MARRAFTLIELLVVVAIIAVLISILIPALKLAREQARDSVCRSNIGQVTRGFLFYANEWRDRLPGSTPDNVTTGGKEQIFDWLGISSVGDAVKRMSYAPHSGTIFRYLNNEKVYLCPSHFMQRETTQPVLVEHRSSYTAPVILTGAPLRLLKSVRYPLSPPGVLTMPERFEDCLQSVMAFITVEEDSDRWLVNSTDSAWCNEDLYTTRHRGAADVGYVDGHAELRKYPRVRNPLSSWHTIYELTDGRRISAGHTRFRKKTIRMGFLDEKDSDY